MYFCLNVYGFQENQMVKKRIPQLIYEMVCLLFVCLGVLLPICFGVLQERDYEAEHDRI